MAYFMDWLNVARGVEPKIVSTRHLAVERPFVVQTGTIGGATLDAGRCHIPFLPSGRWSPAVNAQFGRLNQLEFDQLNDCGDMLMSPGPCRFGKRLRSMVWSGNVSALFILWQRRFRTSSSTRSQNTGG
jgi:hypothetical protein